MSKPKPDKNFSAATKRTLPEPKKAPPTFYFDGKHLTRDELEAERNKVWERGEDMLMSPLPETRTSPPT